MLRALALWIALLLALAAPARGQSGEVETVELRVTSSRPGSATIDRGANDGLAVGDRVLLHPREGFTYEGAITAVEARSATVELFDKGFVPPPGTRGEVRVPTSRLASRAEPAPVEPTPIAPPPSNGAPEHEPWKNADDEWTQGQPLLAKMRPVRPEERPRSIHGRFYSIADQIWSSEDDRTDGFYRVGTNLEVDNIDGKGSAFHFDGEANYRDTDVPDTDDETETRLRLDRLSYTIGGTRFTDTRFEFGRFLQRGLPQFGVLDGAEWSLRLKDGDRYGVSAGFMPEPDAEMETGDDFQFAAFYRWVRDESETFSIAAGIQKTFHDMSADRDLFVAEVDYAPIDDWMFHGTAWVDWYGSTDDAKGQGFGLTQLYAIASRRYESGSSLSFIYNHMEFPEMEREEFLPVTDAQLADDHNDRVAMNGRQRMSTDTRLHAAVGAWIDEDDQGGDAALGVDVEGIFADRNLTDITVFFTSGEFSETLGARLAVSFETTNGRWGIDYEFAQNRIDGFTSANNDLPQHRVRASRDLFWASGWSFSAYAEGQLWDSENALLAGFYLQRSF